MELVPSGLMVGAHSVEVMRSEIRWRSVDEPNTTFHLSGSERGVRVLAYLINSTLRGAHVLSNACVMC